MKMTLMIFIVTLVAAALANLLIAYVQKVETLFSTASLQSALITAAFTAILLPRVLRRS